MIDELGLSQSESLNSLSLGKGIKSTWDPLSDKDLVIRTSDIIFTKGLGACSLSRVHQYDNNKLFSQRTTSAEVSPQMTMPQSFSDFAKFDASSIQSTGSVSDHSMSSSVASSSSVVASGAFVPCFVPIYC